MAVIISKQLTVPSLGMPITNLEVGTLIQINEGGSPVNYRVVHQGLPSSMYDASCDGVWLLREEIHSLREFSYTAKHFGNSESHIWLNGDFLGTLDSGVQSLIKQVKIPYQSTTATSSVSSGANGLSTKIFLLSGYEFGWTTSNHDRFPVDGACLNYFSGWPYMDDRRKAYYNGTSVDWWLRSLSTKTSGYVWYVSNVGSYSYANFANPYGIRPTFVLPANAIVSAKPNADGSYTLIV